MSRAQSALWFATSFGLELKSLTVKERKSRELHTVRVNTKTSEALTSDGERQSGGFEALSLEEKSNVENVLFLLDKFCVGDSFCHELTMTINGLPTSYLVKQRRDQLNDICHITRTPGKAEGAQVLFSDLFKKRLTDYLASHPNGHEDTMRIKISGDGATMTRNSSFILMTFALLDLGDDMMAAKGNHTIAVVKGKENYSTLLESFGDVFQEINKLNSEKKIKVNDRVINLEFFLGGDYKFILLMMGLKGATSYYACVWCKVHKNDRWKMDLDLDDCHSSDLKRT